MRDATCSRPVTTLTPARSRHLRPGPLRLPRAGRAPRTQRNSLHLPKCGRGAGHPPHRGKSREVHDGHAGQVRGDGRHRDTVFSASRHCSKHSAMLSVSKRFSVTRRSAKSCCSTNAYRVLFQQPSWLLQALRSERHIILRRVYDAPREAAGRLVDNRSRHSCLHDTGGGCSRDTKLGLIEA